MVKNEEDGCFAVSISRRIFSSMHLPSSLITCHNLRWNLEMLEEATNEKRSCRILSPSHISHNHTGWYKAEEMQDASRLVRPFRGESPLMSSHWKQIQLRKSVMHFYSHERDKAQHWRMEERSEL